MRTFAMCRQQEIEVLSRECSCCGGWKQPGNISRAAWKSTTPGKHLHGVSLQLPGACRPAAFRARLWSQPCSCGSIRRGTNQCHGSTASEMIWHQGRYIDNCKLKEWTFTLFYIYDLYIILYNCKAWFKPSEPQGLSMFVGASMSQCSLALRWGRLHWGAVERWSSETGDAQILVWRSWLRRDKHVCTWWRHRV